MSKVKAEPSKTDLLRVLKELGSFYPSTESSEKLDSLRLAEDRSQEAIQQFLSGSKTYQKLSSVADKASNARKKEQNRTRKLRSGKVGKLRRRVLLEGPTPSVIGAIKSLSGQLGM